MPTLKSRTKKIGEILICSTSNFPLLLTLLLLFSFRACCDTATIKKIETVRGRGSGDWVYIGGRGRDKEDKIEFEEGGHDGRGGRLGAGRGGHGGQ